MEKEQAYPSNAWAWYTVAILLCAYIFSFIDRQNSGRRRPGSPRSRNHRHEMSLLIGFSFSAVFYSVLGLPFGRLADSISRPRLIIIGMFTWSLMTGGCGLINSYSQLFILRMGVGVGEATLSPAAYSMIFFHFLSRQRLCPFSVYHWPTDIGGGFAFLSRLASPLLRPQADVPASPLGLVPGRGKPFSFSSASPAILFILVLLSLRDPSAKARAFSKRPRKNKSRNGSAA